VYVDVAWLFLTVAVLSMLTRHSVVVNIWHAQDDAKEWEASAAAQPLELQDALQGKQGSDHGRPHGTPS